MASRIYQLSLDSLRPVYSLSVDEVIATLRLLLLGDRPGHARIAIYSDDLPGFETVATLKRWFNEAFDDEWPAEASYLWQALVFPTIPGAKECP